MWVNNIQMLFTARVHCDYASTTLTTSTTMMMMFYNPHLPIRSILF